MIIADLKKLFAHQHTTYLYSVTVTTENIKETLENKKLFNLIELPLIFHSITT